MTPRKDTPAGWTADPDPISRALRDEERKWFPRALDALERAGLPFLVAGFYGLYHYTGFWRDTKDLDVLVLPRDRESAIEAVTSAGLMDLFEKEPYDRDWIYRSHRNDVIVDLIWCLANKEDEVSEAWFERASAGRLLGRDLRVVSAADLCWMKLFVFQARRCDWPDIINIIRGTRGGIDWGELLLRVGPHWRLLCALIDIFDWLCPPERDFVPDWLRRELAARRERDADRDHLCRHRLFDSRPWLTAAGAGRCESGVSREPDSPVSQLEVRPAV